MQHENALGYSGDPLDSVSLILYDERDFTTNKDQVIKAIEYKVGEIPSLSRMALVDLGLLLAGIEEYAEKGSEFAIISDRLHGSEGEF